MILVSMARVSKLNFCGPSIIHDVCEKIQGLVQKKTPGPNTWKAERYYAQYVRNDVGHLQQLIWLFADIIDQLRPSDDHSYHDLYL